MPDKKHCQYKRRKAMTNKRHKEMNMIQWQIPYQQHQNIGMNISVDPDTLN